MSLVSINTIAHVEYIIWCGQDSKLCITY